MHYVLEQKYLKVCYVCMVGVTAAALPISAVAEKADREQHVLCTLPFSGLKEWTCPIYFLSGQKTAMKRH